LGSINLSKINSLEEMAHVVDLASSLGLMGVHEWMLKRGMNYGISDELREYLEIYQSYSKGSADTLTNRLGCTPCVRYRCVAPAGTISILAGTSSGLEPLFSVGTKRRYLEGNVWKYQYVIDPLAETLIKSGVDPDSIETSADLAKDPERRIKFQADIQEYVDMGISSTLNLPPWGTEYNNKDLVPGFSTMIRKYAPKLRGITCYPDGSRGGQPLTHVSYGEALGNVGLAFDEQLEFLSTTSCPSGACGT